LLFVLYYFFTFWFFFFFFLIGSRISQNRPPLPTVVFTLSCRLYLFSIVSSSPVFSVYILGFVVPVCAPIFCYLFTIPFLPFSFFVFCGCTPIGGFFFFFFFFFWFFFCAPIFFFCVFIISCCVLVGFGSPHPPRPPAKLVPHPPSFSVSPLNTPPYPLARKANRPLWVCFFFFPFIFPFLLYVLQIPITSAFRNPLPPLPRDLIFFDYKKRFSDFFFLFYFFPFYIMSPVLVGTLFFFVFCRCVFHVCFLGGFCFIAFFRLYVTYDTFFFFFFFSCFSFFLPISWTPAWCYCVFFFGFLCFFHEFFSFSWAWTTLFFFFGFFVFVFSMVFFSFVFPLRFFWSSLLFPCFLFFFFVFFCAFFYRANL